MDPVCSMCIKKVVVVGGIIILGTIARAVGGKMVYSRNEEAGRIADNTRSLHVSQGGIVTNGHECARIGRTIYEKGGSVADVAIASLVCEGVAMPQSTGIGGGFLLTIYTKSSGVVETLDAREVAPLAATVDMYQENPTESTTGGKSIAVPGEVRGYQYLYQKYGKLPWKDLFQPTIDLCRMGHLVTPFFNQMLIDQKPQILNSTGLKALFIDPKTNEPYKIGERIKRRQLANTLEIIANEGADVFYNGSVARALVSDIQANDGIITLEDMKIYKPRWQAPSSISIHNDLKLFSMPVPGSGMLMNYIINLIDGILDLTAPETVTNYQKIIESFKFAYGTRTLLGDPAFVPGIAEIAANLTNPTHINEIRKKIHDTSTSQDPMYYGANTTVPEDHGTANIAIVLPNGDAIAVTGTINLLFGSKVVSARTGIILNDEMDDFSTTGTNAFGVPSSASNHIEPGKRPMSSMCPTIAINKDGVPQLAIGAAGGSRITTSVALMVIRNLYFKQNLTVALGSPRVHHQMYPMLLEYEDDFNPVIIDELRKIGHKTEVMAKSGFTAVTGVTIKDGIMEGVFDVRRQGSVEILT